jgi:glutamate dehydrogenase (NADP+)
VVTFSPNIGAKTGGRSILYALGRASHAGAVAVSGLEMEQNSMRLSLPRKEVDARIKIIMKNIHKECLDAAEEYGIPGNCMVRANIAGFVKIVNAVIDEGWYEYPSSPLVER